MQPTARTTARKGSKENCIMRMDDLLERIALTVCWASAAATVAMAAWLWWLL